MRICNKLIFGREALIQLSRSCSPLRLFNPPLRLHLLLHPLLDLFQLRYRLQLFYIKNIPLFILQDLLPSIALLLFNLLPRLLDSIKH